MEQRLAAFIRGQAGLSRVTIENLRRMAGGASRETWSFDATLEGPHGTSRRALVLRRDPGEHKIDTSRRNEFKVLQAARQEGVPVPEVLWLGEDPAILGAPFFIMERVEGETIARRLLREDLYARAREVIPAQLADILARIHRVDLSNPALAFLAASASAGGGNPTAAEALRYGAEVLRYYENTFRQLALEPHPAFELALRFLSARIPATRRRTLVHGDYRIGNVIFGPEGVRSILDWELAHAGDPMVDLGWMCVRAWRFGADDRPVGGLGTREDFFAAYEKASGTRVDPEAVRFWEIFGNLRWGIITISQARTYIDGHVPSVELASIGRRTAETELELLNLIEEG